MATQRIELGLTASTPSGGGCGDGCGCGHADAPTPSVSEGLSDSELRVEGMTCAHCVRAVTEELDALDGVEVAGIDLNVGGVSIVRIRSNGTAGDDELAAAIDEAGYALVR
ncbi:heavy-metal-associated domain-containing protein [Microbacterium sp. S1037]|uniref:heavy-metal-associated domain-containing protein n=1 Tax=Microbacterium sp. S1037 TaxID=3398227 RepID=UPI003AAF4A61